MKQRNVDILCLQETKWKRSKVRNIGDDCTLFYNGAKGRKNGIGIVVREELVKSVLEVKRVSERLMAIVAAHVAGSGAGLPHSVGNSSSPFVRL